MSISRPLAASTATFNFVSDRMNQTMCNHGNCRWKFRAMLCCRPPSINLEISVSFGWGPKEMMDGGNPPQRPEPPQNHCGTAAEFGDATFHVPVRSALLQPVSQIAILAACETDFSRGFQLHNTTSKHVSKVHACPARVLACKKHHIHIGNEFLSKCTADDNRK